MGRRESTEQRGWPMPIYLHARKKESLVAWRIENGSAVRLGIAEGSHSPSTCIIAEIGADIWQVLGFHKKIFPNGKEDFHLATLQPGEHYPRIARPTSDHTAGGNLFGPSATKLQKELAIAKSQLSVLLRQLQRICQTIHPSEENMEAFGHDIRNLLILACTEVESHWRAVLTANGYIRDRYSTNDYVKLEQPMKLGFYGLSFVEYPWLPPCRPFAAWGLLGTPTKELPWYDSYNQVKHDRETSFGRAKLRHVFDAVAANAIMVAAQFGFYETLDQSAFNECFLFTDFPEWKPGDVYIRPELEPGKAWTEIKCPI
jgi:hypothetical protein